MNCYFAISKVCNLKCHYCYVPSYNKGHQTDYDRRALDAAQRFTTKIEQENYAMESIVLHGAEPSILSAKTLGKIVNLFQNPTHDDVRIQSNGTRFNGEYLDQLLKVIQDPNHLYIGISIDGSPKIHNPQRDNSWEQVMHNIAELGRRGFRIGLLAVITPLTLRYLKQFEKWVEEMRPQVETITFKLGEHGFGLSEIENQQFAEWLYASKNLKSLQAFQPSLCMHDGNQCEFYEFDIDGNCYACNKNFNDSGIFANWFQEDFTTIVTKRRLLFVSRPMDPECLTCPYKIICQSGCPVTRIQNKSVDCLIKKTIYAKLAEAGVDPQRFFRIEGKSTQETIRLAGGLHKLLLETRPILQAKLHLDSGQLIYRDQNNEVCALSLKRKAADFLRLFLENQEMTIGQSLNRNPDLGENDLHDRFAFLKQLYDTGIILAFE